MPRKQDVNLRGKQWPGENCPLRREFWIQTWHVRLVAATGGRLIKLSRFFGLSTNTNVTFYSNCSNAPFTISMSPSDCLLASTPLKVHIPTPQGAVTPTLKITSLEQHLTIYVIKPIQLCKEASSTIFRVSGMTQPGIEPWTHRPLKKV